MATLMTYGKGPNSVGVWNCGFSDRGMPNNTLRGFRKATGIETINIVVDKKRSLPDKVLKDIISCLIDFFKKHPDLKGTVLSVTIVSRAPEKVADPAARSLEEIWQPVGSPNPSLPPLTIEAHSSEITISMGERFNASNPPHKRMLEEKIVEAAKCPPQFVISFK